MMSHRVFIISLLTMMLLTVPFKFLTDKSAARCHDFGPDGTYMAYCNVTTHGHYDHAAHLFDLEEGMNDRVRQARLLFLGSSRLQFGFSTQAFHDFALRHPTARPYLLGFGHNEKDEFALAILDRIKPRPSLIVINTDNFFARKLSKHAVRLLEDPWRENGYARVKKVWHTLLRVACHGRFPLFEPLLCGVKPTVFRSLEDGRWIFPEPQVGEIPVVELPEEPEDEAVLQSHIATARAFVEKLPVKRACIVLTYVPHAHSKTFLAKRLAEALEMDRIVFPMDDLNTLDGSHLDTASSERWSREFLQRLEPRLTACL